ncbi:MAG: phosphotransferase [Aggregatilineales bacterium]
MTETRQTSDIYGVLLEPGAPRVLMLSDESGVWTLPHVHIPNKRVWVANVGVTCDGMQNLLKTDFIVLRNVHAVYSDAQNHADLIYVLENRHDDWTPPAQSKWINRTELENLALAHPEHRAVINISLHEIETNTASQLRPPWSHPGWFKTASTWMHDQITIQNYVLTKPIEQFKSWGISCLLRAQTDHGNLFFKVSTALPLFGNEPALLEALSKRYPDFVPAPFAIQIEQRWMLMQDFGTELRMASTLERWETAMQRFGTLQVQATSAVEDLFAIGCLDRRLNVLAAQIDPLLNDMEVLALLTADELVQIRALAPRLKAMCSELAGYYVPYSLNHGDLHSGNITAQSLLFFDWTDACIAHPFLDLSTVMKDVDESVSGGREPVLNAYLNLWIDYEPMERLREMWKLAEPLGALHQAVSYQHIVAILEPTSKQELADGIPIWLRRVLKTMPE